jgi:hypothetical protein
MNQSRKKALEALRGLADEALRSRFASTKAPKAPPPEPKQDEELSPEDSERLAKFYEEETTPAGRA